MLVRIVLLLCCVCVVFTSNAQTYKSLFGRIVDKGKVPIAGVNIRTLDNKLGTVSGLDGNFSLNFKDSSLSVILSFVGFLNDTVVLNNSTNGITLVMQEDIKAIEEVTVYAESFTVLAGNNNYRVLDYEVKDFVYVLLERKRNYYLHIYHPIFDTKIDSIQLFGISGTELFVDCFNNLHVIGEDSVAQIYYDFDDQLLLTIDKIARKKFEDNIRNCIVSNDNYLLYVKNNEHAHSTNFIAYNKIDKTQTTFRFSKDTIAAKVSQQDLNEIITLYNSVVPETENVILNGAWDGQLLKLAINFGLMVKISWYMHISTNVKKSFVYPTETEYYIYDNIADKLVTYNEQLIKINETQIKFSTTPKWIGFVSDYTSPKERLFAHFQNSISTLKEIQISTGRYTGLEYKVKYHSFPENIQMAYGKIYYMHRNEGGLMKLIYQKSIDKNLKN